MSPEDYIDIAKANWLEAFDLLQSVFALPSPTSEAIAAAEEKENQALDAYLDALGRGMNS